MTECLCVGIIHAGILTVKYMADGRVIVESSPAPVSEHEPHLPPAERLGAPWQRPC